MDRGITLQVNGRAISLPAETKLSDLEISIKPDADIFIINGFPVEQDSEVKEGDTCWLLRRGEKPAQEEIQSYLYARHTPGVQEKIKDSVVGVMGLGGLGSPVAIALARIGVGKLVLADYDIVEPTNLNRQQYFIDQIGMKKTEALQNNIYRINPFIEVTTIDTKLTENSIPKLFKEVNVLVECFDDPIMKAAALRAVRTNLKGVAYIGASGVAGYGNNNRITTKKLYPQIYVVGDGETAAAPGMGLMAPRVGIAAHHQANQVLRILLKS